MRDAPDVKWFAIGGAVLAVVVIGVALFVRSGTTENAEAEKTVNGLYEAIGRGDYEAAMDFYAPEFIATTGRSEFIASLKSINEKLGARQDGHTVESGIQPGGGEGVDLTYKNEYSNGSAVEKFRFVQVDGEYRISAHSYESDVLPR